MRYIFFILISIFFISIFGFSQESQPTVATFNHEKFIIEYPSFWKLDSSGVAGTAVFISSNLERSSDYFKENLNVMIQDLHDQDIDLEAYRLISESQIETGFEGAIFLQSELVDSPRGERYELEYTVRINDRDMHITSYCYIVNGKAYLITFTAEETSFETFSKIRLLMLNSFKLKTINVSE